MNRILQITIGLLLACSVHAQFKAGLHTGVDFNTLHLSGVGLDINDEIKYFNSPRLGIHGEYAFSKRWSILSELNYTQNGFRVEESTTTNVLGIDVPIGVRASTRLNYLEVPLLIKYSFGLQRLSYYAEAGPSVSRGINGKITPQASLLVDLNLPQVNIDFRDQAYRRWLIGANLGVGMNYALSDQIDLHANLRYTGSLNDIVQNQLVDLSVKSNTIHMGVGISKKI